MRFRGSSSAPHPGPLPAQVLPFRLAARGGSRRATAVVLLVLACGGLTALQAQTTAVASQPASTIAVVPVVGSVDGVGGVRWRTEVELRNETGSAIDVIMQLPSAVDQPFYGTTLAIGQSLRFNDVVAEAFSTETALSPMLVSTSGRRSVTIRANAYAVHGTEVSPPEPISVDYGQTFYPITVLKGLSFSDQYRTNIGLVNLSDNKDAAFTLALQRIPGRNLAVTHVTLPPTSNTHTSIQSMFPLIPTGDDFSIVVESGSPETSVYASVIENGTSTGKFIRPLTIASTP